jgi:hypothetical protein
LLAPYWLCVGPKPQTPGSLGGCGGGKGGHGRGWRPESGLEFTPPKDAEEEGSSEQIDPPVAAAGSPSGPTAAQKPSTGGAEGGSSEPERSEGRWRIIGPPVAAAGSPSGPTAAQRPSTDEQGAEQHSRRKGHRCARRRLCASNTRAGQCREAVGAPVSLSEARGVGEKLARQVPRQETRVGQPRHRCLSKSSRARPGGSQGGGGQNRCSCRRVDRWGSAQGPAVGPGS